MATLQVRGIDDKLYAALKTIARQEHRSLSQEVVSILDIHVRNLLRTNAGATEEFIKLSSSWQDSRSANEIVGDIRKHLLDSNRFGTGHVVFD